MGLEILLHLLEDIGKRRLVKQMFTTSRRILPQRE